MRDKITKQYLLTIILVFLLLFIMLVYIFSSFYRTSVSNIRELGVKNIKNSFNIKRTIDIFLSRY